MNYKRTIILILAFVFFVVVGLWLWNNIFYPSYLSVVTECGGMTKEELALRGMMVGGSTLSNFTVDNRTEEIVPEISFSFFSNDTQTIRHEICHSKSVLFKGCDHLILKYAGETECYIKQRLPLYNKEIKQIQEDITNDN